MYTEFLKTIRILNCYDWVTFYSLVTTIILYSVIRRSGAFSIAHESGHYVALNSCNVKFHLTKHKPKIFIGANKLGEISNYKIKQTKGVFNWVDTSEATGGLIVSDFYTVLAAREIKNKPSITKWNVIAGILSHIIVGTLYACIVLLLFNTERKVIPDTLILGSFILLCIINSIYAFLGFKRKKSSETSDMAYFLNPDKFISHFKDPITVKLINEIIHDNHKTDDYGDFASDKAGEALRK